METNTKQLTVIDLKGNTKKHVTCKQKRKENITA